VQLDYFLDIIEEGLARAIDPGPKEIITSHHLNAYLEYPPTLMPGALDVLDTLTGHGYKIALICNSGTTPGSLQRKWLEEQGIVRYMEVLTFSDEVELAKPSSEIFLVTLSALDVLPHLSAHIGDRPETDILGAKRVGMRAILIGGGSGGPPGVEYLHACGRWLFSPIEAELMVRAGETRARVAR
jgi:putative hydrolase of the HAD superfamily